MATKAQILRSRENNGALTNSQKYRQFCCVDALQDEKDFPCPYPSLIELTGLTCPPVEPLSTRQPPQRAQGP